MKSSQTGDRYSSPECRAEWLQKFNFNGLMRHLQIQYERAVYYKACHDGEIKGNNRRNKHSIIGAHIALGRKNMHVGVFPDTTIVKKKWLCKHIASFIMIDGGRFPWRHLIGFNVIDDESIVYDVIVTMHSLGIVNVDLDIELTWLK